MRAICASLAACLVFVLSLPASANGLVAKTLELEGYEIQFIADKEIPFTARLRVKKGEAEVYDGPFVAHLGSLDEAPGSRNSAFPIEPGTDVTGDGRPDLVLLSFSGGAHCCFALEIYSLAPDFKLIATVDGENSPPLLQKREGEAAYVIELVDWTFAYWHAPFVESPSPLVYLRWSGDDYQPAPDLMRGQPLSENDLERKVATLAKDMAEAGKPIPGLWREMLQMIYTGQAAQAFQLLDGAWPEDQIGRAAYLTQFGAQLGLSPFFPALIKLNEWPDF